MPGAVKRRDQHRLLGIYLVSLTSADRAEHRSARSAQSKSETIALLIAAVSVPRGPVPNIDHEVMAHHAVTASLDGGTELPNPRSHTPEAVGLGRDVGPGHKAAVGYCRHLFLDLAVGTGRQYRFFVVAHISPLLRGVSRVSGHGD